MSEVHQSTDVSTGLPYLFTQLLSGNESAARKLYPQLMRCLEKVARKKSNGLPDDLIDDVVIETWAIAIQRGPENYDPKKGSVTKYLCTIMRDAVRTVRAQYAPAGQMTRSYNRKSEPVISSKIICRDAFADNAFFSSEESNRLTYDPNKDQNIVFAKLILDKIKNPDRDILEKVYLLGDTQKKVAEDLGLSRFKVNRIISNVVNDFQEDIQNASTASGWN